MLFKFREDILLYLLLNYFMRNIQRKIKFNIKHEIKLRVAKK
jgi:hypothetical protein